MMYFRKRLIPKRLGEINEIIVRNASSARTKRRNLGIKITLTMRRALVATAVP